MTTEPERVITAGIAGGPGAHTKLSPAAEEYAASRGISRRTLDLLGVAAGTVYFPRRLQRKSEAVVFPYTLDYEVVNRKYAAFPEKDFIGDKGGALCFMNLDSVVEADPGDVYLVEGEWDLASLVEAGVPDNRVLSVPNGARDRHSDEDEGDMPSGYGYVDDALDRGLSKHHRFIWCGDMDDAGRALRADMAKMFGAARFWFVDWPEGCKDANDFLQSDGPAELKDLVEEGRQPWPVSGIYSLSDLPEPAKMEVWRIPKFPSAHGRIMLAPKTLSVVTGHPGHGKALALDTPIPTPSGWSTMGALAIGDLVFDEAGQQCRVTLVTPVMLHHDCFRVEFDDGSSIIADADHMWLTETEAARQSERAWCRRGSRKTVKAHGTDQSAKRIRPSVVTTRDIESTLMANGKHNHAIRLAQPIQMATADLPIPPYTLGAWLGDGDSRAAIMTCAEVDVEIIENISAEGVPVRRLKVVDRTAKWSLSDGIKNPRKDCVQSRLRKLGLLGNKHIPAIYKRASVEQRAALLQGLMDTDGHIACDRQAEFCTINRRLAEEFYELICSFGVRARILSGRATLNGVDCGEKHRVTFSTAISVFRLKRKAAKQGDLPSRRKYRYVTAVQAVPTVPVRCIQVDSPSHLYLAGRSFIPTHNTQLFAQIWHDIAEENGLVIAAVTFETQAKPHYRRILRTLQSGKLERDMDSDEIARADSWINDHYKWLVHPGRQATLKWVLDMAEVAVVRYGAKVLSIDPWNRLESRQDERESETKYILRCLNELYDFAQDMGVHVQVLAHPAKMDGPRKGKAPELDDISGSKHWDNVVDQGFVVHRPKMFEDGARRTEAHLFQKKARHEELGYPCRLAIRYDLATGRFVEDVKQ